MRTCVYQGVRNVSFSEDIAYALKEWSLFWDTTFNNVSYFKA